MFVIANGVTYRSIRNLHFAPTLDVVINRLAIDEFECDYHGESIPVGTTAVLKDDTDNLWFSGIVTYSEDNHIIVQSTLCYLDRITLPARMYEQVPMDDAISECFVGVPAEYVIDSAATAGKTVTGYAKEMTGRERLQQLLFIAGAYVETSFVEVPTISVIDLDNSTEVPIDVTYYKPKRVYKDYVSDVSVTAFSFREGTPTQDDEYVTANGRTWIVTRLTFTQHNPLMPPSQAPNIVKVDDVMLVSNDNVSVIASILASYYFKRMSVEFDAINNAEYKCGEQLKVHLDGDNYSNMANGFLESCNFSFGTQAKAHMVLGAAEEINAEDWVTLTIEYICASNNEMKGVKVGERSYLLSKGSQYTVTNPYITKSVEGFKYVFRPATIEKSGSIGTTDETIQVNCYTALKQNLSTGVLRIISVDSVERVSKEVDGKTIYTAEIE